MNSRSQNARKHMIPYGLAILVVVIAITIIFIQFGNKVPTSTTQIVPTNTTNVAPASTIASTTMTNTTSSTTPSTTTSLCSQFSVENITIWNPSSATYDPGNGYVYVTNDNYPKGEVYVISGTSVIANITVGAYPSSATYDPGNGYVYVMDWDSGTTVSVISGTSVIANITVGILPMRATYDPRNGYIYIPGSVPYNSGKVANNSSSSGKVAVISGTSVIAIVPVVRAPVSAVYNPSNGYVYIMNWGSNTVPVISGTSVIANITVGVPTFSAAYDPRNGYIYIAGVATYNSGKVAVISGTSVIANITDNAAPGDLTYDSRNGYVYIMNWGSNKVSVLTNSC